MFELTNIERESALWKKLELHLLLRLEEARRRNEADLNEVETAKLRGRILELKALLAQAVPAPAHDTSDAEAAPEAW